MKLYTSEYEFADKTKLTVTTDINIQKPFEGTYQINISLRTCLDKGTLDKKYIRHFILKNINDICNEIDLK